MMNRTWFMTKYLAIITVFLVLLYFASRYLIKVRTVTKKGSMKVIDLLRLGPDSFIYIVEAMNRRYLIAQNKNAITLLDKETDFEQVLTDALPAEQCSQQHSEEDIADKTSL